MSGPESLGAVLAPALALHHARTLACEVEEKLRELHDFCVGCDCPASSCGPVLWSTQRKCCPDCSHKARA